MAKHPDWTDEATAKLWDYYGALPADDVPYFSRLLGDGVLNFAEQAGILKGEVLDYGSGPGYIVKKLLDRGLSVSALDFSLRSCGRLGEAMKANPNFKGVHHVEKLPSPFPDSRFDLVVCSEVVEHLPDSWLSSTVAELFRIVKTDGHVIITTPYRENLRKDFVYCPFCDCDFHKWQHQRTFCENALMDVLKNACFEIVFCRQLNFIRFQDHLPSLFPMRKLSVERMGDWLAFCCKRLLDHVTNPAVAKGWAFSHLVAEGPHLVAIVKKAYEPKK